MSSAARLAALAAISVWLPACGGSPGSSEETGPSAHPTRPFELQVTQDSLSLLRGKSTSLTVGVTGVDEADWPVTITLEPLPKGVSTAALQLQAANVSGELGLMARESAPLGSHEVDVIARGGLHELRHTLRVEIAARGDRDSTWGPNGSAVLSVRNSERLIDLAVDETGRLYASLQDSGGGLRVLRLTSDGTPDERFGSKGFASLGDFEATAMLAQPDGLLLAGSTQMGAAVARLGDQGTVDPSFGDSGITTLDATGAAVAIRANEGGIIVAGGDQTLFVASLDPDGAVLALHTLTRGVDRSLKGAITADAVYLIWDEYDDAEAWYVSSLIKSDLEGVADLSFAVDGVADLVSAALTADARGGIVACGFKMSHYPYPALLRFGPDGRRDLTWGTTLLPLSIGTGGCWKVVQAGADLVTAAGAASLEETVLEIFLLSANGRIDPAFGGDGALRFRLAPFASTGIASDHESVVVGWSADGTLELRRFLL